MSSLDATLLVTNAQLLTQNAAQPVATAMAVAGDRILAVGDEHRVARLATVSTQWLDLQGKTVVPGFCDCHVHLFWYGAQLLRQADLVGAADVADVLGRLEALAERTVGWIQGHGFDQSKMAEGRFPTRAELDRVSRTRPIIISRVCGHATVVNSAALALVSGDQRDAGDAESGLYTEGASSAFYAKVPPLSEEEAEQAVLLASNVALRTGITSVQTLLDVPEQMSAYARLRRRGRLPIRVVGMPPQAAVGALHAHGVNSTFGDEWVRFGAAKLFSDGSLGAQTALLAEPYADAPQTKGLRIYAPDDLRRRCRDAQAKGFQLAVHAIGDQALRETLEAIEHALDGQDNRLHRHRVEHASVCPPDLLERLASRRVVVTAQPQFVTSDTWTADRVGPGRRAWCYPFRSMVEAGVPLGLSSDCPVEKLDAFDCLAAAVGRHAWSPEQTLTVEQALHAYTMGSAYAAHAEARQGSLAPGKLADFVVLSGDPRTLSAEGIRRLKAEQVYVGGKRVV